MQSATEKSNGSNEPPSESSGNANANANANGGSDPHINPGFLRISVEERAATRIQKAFRAYRVRCQIGVYGQHSRKFYALYFLNN